MEDIPETQSFTPMFFTISVLLFIALCVLVLYTKDIMSDVNHSIVLKEAQLKTAKLNFDGAREEINRLNVKIRQYRDGKLLPDEKKEFVLQNQHNNQIIAELKTQLESYEAILQRSNNLIIALIERVKVCESK